MLVNQNVVFVVFIVTLTYFNSPCLGYHLLPHSNTSLLRKTRQTNCGSTQFACLSGGECLVFKKVCDGRRHCTDGSDETNGCKYVSCPDNAFRCKYGACVDSNFQCDGQQECADGSDEDPVICRSGAIPPPTSTNFACISGGVYLNFNKVCDGRRDCSDGSDESYGCKYVSCPDNAFRCKYGACVDGNFKCSGQKECADGSDEDPAICGSGTTPTPVPQPPPTSVPQPQSTEGICSAVQIDNSQYKVLGQNGQNYSPGSPIPNYSIVKFTCNENYALYPNYSILSCVDGNWNIPLPQCKKSCSPRISSSVNVTCTLDGKPVDCSQPLVEGTVADSKCNEYYKQDDNVAPISRCSGGSWDNPLIRCQLDLECGKVVAEGGPLIINGQNTKRGEFPWHVAIYRKIDEYEYICGGSIITPLIILTAASCIHFIPVKDLSVGAGKYYRDYNADGDKLAQKRQVKECHTPDAYRGHATNYQANLALCVLKKPFQMTNVVQPVCIDWDNALESQQLKPGNIGTVMGWDIVNPNKQQSNEELKQLNVPYIDVDQCYAVVPSNFHRGFTTDKFCAGFTNGSSVCKKDSGGGLVFKWTENNSEKYYIRGLVAVEPLLKGDCENFQYGLYNRISFYKDFIQKIIVANPVKE